jgi:hypothetical protein
LQADPSRYINKLSQVNPLSFSPGGGGERWEWDITPGHPFYWASNRLDPSASSSHQFIPPSFSFCHILCIIPEAMRGLTSLPSEAGWILVRFLLTSNIRTICIVYSLLQPPFFYLLDPYRPRVWRQHNWLNLHPIFIQLPAAFLLFSQRAGDV